MSAPTSGSREANRRRQGLTSSAVLQQQAGGRRQAVPGDDTFVSEPSYRPHSSTSWPPHPLNAPPSFTPPTPPHTDAHTPTPPATPALTPGGAPQPRVGQEEHKVLVVQEAHAVEHPAAS